MLGVLYCRPICSLEKKITKKKSFKWKKKFKEIKTIPSGSRCVMLVCMTNIRNKKNLVILLIFTCCYCVKSVFTDTDLVTL